MSGDDTIYALSSGAGRAAIAIVRIAGSKTADILRSMIGGSLPEARRLVVRRLIDPSAREVLDEAMVVWLPGPSSFTGEDCAELHLHASTAVLSAVFACFRCFPGVRLAEAGEFTLRAVLNGRMDLVEAEGVGDLLMAQTGLQRKQALGQVLGGSSCVFETWRERLIEIRADIEAAVDFADDEGVMEVAARRVDGEIEALLRSMTESLLRSSVAEAIRDGVKVVLTGLPNTGKSSLLNAVARRDAAIVSAIPGTTRDVIEVALDVAGVPVLLTDTAGVRDGPVDEVEAMGVSRAIREVEEADIVVLVVSPDVSGHPHLDKAVVPDVVVAAKADIGNPDLRLIRNKWPGAQVVELSANTGEGIETFVKVLGSLLVTRFSNAEPSIVVSARQKQCTQDSIRFLNDSLGHDNYALELKAEAVRSAAESIGRITGRTDVEEWLGAIFSRFCIGK